MAIDGDKLFQAILEERRRREESLRATYQTIGKNTIDGTEVNEYTKGSVREYQGRIAELEWVITEMQRIARETE